jgi:hypothetical protein
MRRAPSNAFVAAVVGSLVTTSAGCTFLISFDEVPPADAGSPVEASVPPPVQPPEPGETGAPEPGADSGDARAPVPVMPACDATFPLDQVKGCAGFLEGAQVCADNPGLTAYPGDRTKDVVTCSKNGATCVRHCEACAHLPEGFPDQCDLCMGKPNGKYCGTDMGWQPQNFRLLVTCTNDRMQNAAPCSARGCDSKGGTGSAACKP